VKPLVFVLLYTILVLPLNAEEYLTGVFYFPLGPRSLEDLEEPPVEQEVYRRILEEARYVFSGMIYGFSFVYTPSDASRNIDEYYQIEPLAQIPWGDERLKVRSSRKVSRDLYITCEYFLTPSQQVRMSTWQRVNHPSGGGLGEAPYFLGWESRFTALEEGIKEGVRNYLRPRIYNKPREIVGEVLLTDVPSFHVDAGMIRANVRMKLNILEVVPYKSF